METRAVVFASARPMLQRLRGRYRTAYGKNLRGGGIISRADVAHAMLAALGQPATVRQEIGIAY
jgi:putative NADH-flavin reductase